MDAFKLSLPSDDAIPQVILTDQALAKLNDTYKHLDSEEAIAFAAAETKNAAAQEPPKKKPRRGKAATLPTAPTPPATAPTDAPPAAGSKKASRLEMAWGHGSYDRWGDLGPKPKPLSGQNVSYWVRDRAPLARALQGPGCSSGPPLYSLGCC